MKKKMKDKKWQTNFQSQQEQQIYLKLMKIKMTNIMNPKKENYFKDFYKGI